MRRDGLRRGKAAGAGGEAEIKVASKAVGLT
jgi:hypothetical protein